MSGATTAPAVDYLAYSDDRRFGVRLGAKTIAQMLKLCRAARGRETGGVLVGRYDDDQSVALVTRISGPPRGSQHGRWSFYRAVGHLQRWLDRLWARGHTYYLGEWHFHPRGSPEPSATDIAQMGKIASDAAYACPEPILVIIGGEPNSDWTIGASVFLRRRRRTRLVPAVAAIRTSR